MIDTSRDRMAHSRYALIAVSLTIGAIGFGAGWSTHASIASELKDRVRLAAGASGLTDETTRLNGQAVHIASATATEHSGASAPELDARRRLGARASDFTPSSGELQDAVRARKMLAELPEKDRARIALEAAQAHPEIIGEMMRGLLVDPSAQQRRLALELAAVMPPEVLQTLRASAGEALKGESDPQVIAGLLVVLGDGMVAAREGSEPPASAQAVPAIDPFVLQRQLGRPEPLIRGTALAVLAEVDRSAAVEPLLLESMDDPSTEVRQFAIATAVTSDFRSDAVKNKLFAIAANQNSEYEIRGQAQMALRQFRLTAEEEKRLSELDQLL